VVDIIHELQAYKANIDVYDPWVSPAEAEHEYGIKPIPNLQNGRYDAVILAVGHRQFQEMGADGIRRLCKSESVLFDVKGILPKASVDDRL